jgi:membrane protease YdiL (CAAX protease family)
MFFNQQWNLDMGHRGVLAPGRFLSLRAIAWSALLFLLALFFFFAMLYQFPWLHLPDTIWVGLLGPVLAFIAYALAVQTAERRTALEVLPSHSTLYELVIGFAFGFTMISATLALLWALGLFHVQLNHLKNGFAFFVSNAWISGTLEELAFRAILLRLFARAFGPGWGLALSSAAFGAAHLSHATWLAAAEIAFNGGLTMGILYMATGRLWMSIGLHLAWDFTEGAILGVDHSSGLLLSTPTPGKPDLLTGGTFGPDASLLAALVGAVFIAAILYANAKGLFNFNKRRLLP